MSGLNVGDIYDVGGVYKKQQVVQVVNVTDGAVATGTTVLPYDDTVPQITEGDQYMTRTITPKSATNILKIEVNLLGTHTVASFWTTALFQDSTASALAATGYYGASAELTQWVITHYMAAGTTSETTFRVRAGCSAAGTFTFNGDTGVRKYGGVASSSITITEYQPS